MIEIKITENEAGKIIKDYLRHDLGYSNGLIKKLKFREDGITVNGEHRNVLYVLCVGDILRLCEEDREEDTCPYMIPVDLPLGIIYEDNDIVVVNKPPFMPAHPSYKHREDTVANALAARYSGEPYVFRPVNRLDRDTSGLMIVARNRLAAIKMAESMMDGKIQKTYIAVLSKAPEKDEGRIVTYMRRKEASIIERCVCDETDEGAKIAITDYKVVRKCDNGLAVCEVRPVTGRTHQIRVHFSYIGCPLCGDEMYGGTTELINRQALHANKLEFTHPNGKAMTLEAPLPDDINTLIY